MAAVQFIVKDDDGNIANIAEVLPGGVWPRIMAGFSGHPRKQKPNPDFDDQKPEDDDNPSTVPVSDVWHLLFTVEAYVLGAAAGSIETEVKQSASMTADQIKQQTLAARKPIYAEDGEVRI